MHVLQDPLLNASVAALPGEDIKNLLDFRAQQRRRAECAERQMPWRMKFPISTCSSAHSARGAEFYESGFS